MLVAAYVEACPPELLRERVTHLLGVRWPDGVPVSRTRIEAVEVKQTALERHYRIGELAAMWSLGRETVRLLEKDEEGVIKIRLGRKKPHTIYSVPESVARHQVA